MAADSTFTGGHNPSSSISTPPPLSTTTVTPTTTTTTTMPTTATLPGGAGGAAGPTAAADPLLTSKFHAFPPSFTLQPNLSTRASQLASWSRLVRAHCAYRRQWRLVVADALASPLFHNARIGRRLGHAEAMAVLEYMCCSSPSSTNPSASSSTTTTTTTTTTTADDENNNSSSNGTTTTTGGTGGGGGAKGQRLQRAEWITPDRTAAWIYWRRPEEWAELMAGWVEATGQRGVVLTLYELTQGESTERQDFYGMPDELLRKVLQVLVKRGKAQVFGTSGEQGVKFS